MSSNAFERLVAVVLADEAVAASLAGASDATEFVRRTDLFARGHGIADLDAASLNALGNDPLGLSRWTLPRLSGRDLPPRHWLPIQIGAAPGAIAVDWAWFGAGPLRESFFEDSIRRTLSLPFARLFRYRTTLADLIERADALPSRAPDGFIFHMSRCGSTLVAQMLAALPQSIVVSEAAPIDSVVQLARGSASDEVAARALRAIVTTFGRLRAGTERRYVVKLDSWHTLALPLFRRAFPEVPWIFLYRDPIEVMVSQMRQRGTQMLPQVLSPRLWGILDDDAVPDEDYCARVLSTICNAAADSVALGGGCLVDYRDLPDAVFSTIIRHFGMTIDAAERSAMELAAARDAKAPSQRFAADIAAKQREASDAVRRAVERHLADAYRRLEQVRASYCSSISMQMVSPR